MIERECEECGKLVDFLTCDACADQATKDLVKEVLVLKAERDRLRKALRHIERTTAEKLTHQLVSEALREEEKDA